METFFHGTGGFLSFGRACAFLSALVFLSGMLLAESLYNNPERFSYHLSDLGVGSTAFIFNSTLILTGLLIAIAGTLFFLSFRSFKVMFFPLVSGLAVIGVGLFPLNVEPLHTIVSAAASIFLGLTAVLSSFISKKPLAHVFAFLGILSLLFTAVIALNMDFGLGIGFTQRMIVYPLILWGLLIGLFFQPKEV